MLNRITTSCLAAIVSVVAIAAPAAAQTRQIEQYDIELGVKYSLLQEEDFDWATKGLLVDGAFKVCTAGDWRCQVVAELAINSFPEFSDGDSHRHTQFAGGLRLGRLSGERARPFLQVLVGRQSCNCGADATTFEFGGGVNVGLTEMLDLQVQADVPIARFSGNTIKQFRLSFGIALPLGAR